MKNPIKWLKEEWDFYCDWYYLDEWVTAGIMAFGIAVLWAFNMGMF